MQSFYRDLYEFSPDAILIIVGDRFVDCNPAAVRMLGYTDKQVLLDHLHPADISPPEQPDGRGSREKAKEMLKVAFERGSHTFEWMHLDKDGEQFLVEVQLTLVERGGEQVIHCVWRDISERKRLEEELRCAQRLEAIGRLAGGVAHDFNNLLVVIMGHAELLEEELEGSAANPEHVQEIRSAADRATRLTRQLLTFSRGHPKQVKPTDLVLLVKDLSELLRRLIGEHIEVVLELNATAPTVFADPSQLEQVIINLVVNSRDAMPSGGRMCLRVENRDIGQGAAVPGLVPGSHVALQVTDTGEGMTRDQVDRAFDPFFTTKGFCKGTGLGLTTVQAIVTENGGHVEIHSEPGSGTTVEVLLPVSVREAEPVGSRASPSLPSHGGETILLVEDERAIRDLFAEVLASRGYDVITSEDGQQALDLIRGREKAIDLLVTDVIMPRVSGPELARRLTSLWPQVKVLFMSGYSEEPDLASIPPEDQATVLAKPLTPGQLQTAVRRVLDL